MNLDCRNSRREDIITVLVFLFIIFSFAVLFFILPDKKISDEENRTLQQLPKFSTETLVSGKLTGDIGKYYADQFPFRNTFVGVKTAVSYAFLINQNKDAVICNDDYVIRRYDIYDEADANFDLKFSFSETMKYVKSNCEYINIFRENLLKSSGINLTFAVVPRKIDVMTNKLPAFFPIERNEAYYNTLEENISKDIYFDLKAVLLTKNGEYIYYRTDHHWTTLGAYYSYASLGGKMGYTPKKQGDFSIQKVSENFYGTTWAKAGAKWIPPDDIYYYRNYSPDENIYTDTELFRTNINQQREINGFYDFDYLEKRDKYSSFIGGINAHTSVHPVEKAEEVITQKKKLLLITDSFGQSIVPFLAQHYALEIIDLRFFNENIYQFINDHSITDVLILQGMESLSSQNNLIKLRMELE